jgi:hypothetical protein
MTRAGDVAAEMTDLATARDETVALIAAIPDAALGWRPGDDERAPRQTIGHLAHACDFYVMIVEEARASEFGDVRLSSELAGGRRMEATDAEVAGCAATPDALASFERAHSRLLAVLAGVTSEELDRAFHFHEPRAGAEPRTTTLRRRVLTMAALHLREHHDQLAGTLANWRSAGAGGALGK